MPKHGIAGVKKAHPVQYKFCRDKERRTQIQHNWERFLRNNPGYRPAHPPWSRPAPCIVHNIAAIAPRKRCNGGCISGKTRTRLDEMLDHYEPWHVVDDGQTVPVLFGHPYLVTSGYGNELIEFLKGLPGGTGESLAIFEVTVEGARWIPQVSGIS